MFVVVIINARIAVKIIKFQTITCPVGYDKKLKEISHEQFF